jgi:hypothetical protein
MPAVFLAISLVPMTKMVVEKADLLLALEIVGGRAAFDVDRAVLHQRDAVGRGDGHQFGVDLGQLEFSLDAFDGLQHQFMRVTDDLLLVVVIREGNRGFAVAEGDGAGVLDLFQGQGFLGLGRQNSGSSSGRWQVRR